jgi:hypothetical protein
MSPRNERAFRIGIMVVLVLTVGLSALAFTYLRQSAGDEDPWTYKDVPDRGPESALVSVGAELSGGRSKYLKCVAPEKRGDSHQLLFDLRGRPLVLRVIPDPSDAHVGKLIWDTPAGQRTVCRGVRPGGFRVLEIEDGWILKLEVVRMDREGNPTDLDATKTVRRSRKS